MSRTLERSIARKQYEKFARRWREEKRMAGVYGKQGYRKPSFSEWYGIHQRDLEMMRQSTPSDVQEYLSPGVDPWAEEKPAAETSDGERGVVTIDIAGSGDE